MFKSKSEFLKDIFKQRDFYNAENQRPQILNVDSDYSFRHKDRCLTIFKGLYFKGTDVYLSNSSSRGFKDVMNGCDYRSEIFVIKIIFDMRYMICYIRYAVWSITSHFSVYILYNFHIFTVIFPTEIIYF